LKKYNESLVNKFTQAISHLFRERSFEWQVEDKGKNLELRVATGRQLVADQDTVLQGPASVSVNFDDDPSKGEGYATDILGVYRHQKGSSNIGDIVLFDKPINRVAKDLGCDATMLARVVLYHELAHLAVHVIRGNEFSEQSITYHEQWAQCLAYWAMTNEYRKIFEILEKKQSSDYQLREEGFKEFLCGEDSKVHVIMINMLLGSYRPSKTLAFEGLDELIENNMIIQNARNNPDSVRKPFKL